MVHLYNLSIVAGTAYLVAVYAWSPWWFLLAFMLLNVGVTKKTKDDRDE
jgi:hypothetical protein